MSIGIPGAGEAVFEIMELAQKLRDACDELSDHEKRLLLRCLQELPPGELCRALNRAYWQRWLGGEDRREF